MSISGEVFEAPDNPYELAVARALEPQPSDFEVSEAGQFTLSALDHAADTLGFHGQSYFVSSRQAFVIPASFDADRPVTFTKLGDGVSFEGSFATFSRVHIGRIIGGDSVRALCLSFGDTLLLPFFDRVPETEILHVPVLAVEDMTLAAG